MTGDQGHGGLCVCEECYPSPRRCVVIPSDAKPWWDEPNLDYRRCGGQVVAEVGAWPVCAAHYALFTGRESAKPSPSDPEPEGYWQSVRDAGER